MVRMFIRHKVDDYGKWRQAYDAFESERRDMGVISDAVFQTAGDPLDVIVWHDFATLDEAQSFAASQRLKDVMKDAGVKSEPDIWFTILAS